MGTSALSFIQDRANVSGLSVGPFFYSLDEVIFTVSSVSLCRSVHASVPESFRASVVRSARRSSGFFFLVKAALAAGKNRKVLLLMMRAFAPSATTASDPTTSSGFGSGLSSGSQSKNSHSYLKLILYCCLPNGCQHTKFHPNWTKNWLYVGLGWLVR